TCSLLRQAPARSVARFPVASHFFPLHSHVSVYRMITVDNALARPNSPIVKRPALMPAPKSISHPAARPASCSAARRWPGSLRCEAFGGFVCYTKIPTDLELFPHAQIKKSLGEEDQGVFCEEDRRKD